MQAAAWPAQEAGLATGISPVLDIAPGAIPWLVLLPLTAAALAFITGRRRAPLLGLVVAAGVLIVAVITTAAVVRGGTFRVALGGWGAPLGIDWRVDGLAATMLLLTAVIGAGVTLYSAASLPRAERQTEWFWPLFLLLWTGLNALFLTADAFNAYVTLELVSLAAVTLVTLDGKAAPLLAGMRYLLVALVGSLGYLLAIALLYASFGTLDFAALSHRVTAGPATSLALALATAGLFAKAAFFPLHAWLPPAHGAAPAPASALLSALVVKAGFYLLLRLWFEVFAPSGFYADARNLLGVCGAGAVLWGSVAALRQVRLKPLLAYSTVAQLGYLLLLFPLADLDLAWLGAMTQVAAHATAKAAMFLAAGLILAALGHDRLDGIGGAAQAVPMTVFAFGLAGLSLVGLPPSGGFAAKWLLLLTAFESGRWWWGVVLLGGGVLAAGYVFGVLARAFAGAGDAAEFTRVPRTAEWAALLLAILSLLLGFVSAGPLQALWAGGRSTGMAP